jgi:hypothetical protein
MKRVLLTAILMLSLIIRLPLASAHGSGPPYLLVNGRYAQTNPIQGLATDIFSLDTTSETFVVGESIQFEVDLKNLGFNADVRWKWNKSDSNYEEGLKQRHTYSKPGSYFVTLQVKGPPTNNKFADFNSVRINVAPKEGYVAPSVKIVAEGKDGGEEWDVTYKAEVTKDPSATIESYKWFLGDGAQADSQLINHSYKKGFYQAFPFLIVEDSNGLFAAMAFQIDESNNKFTIKALPFFPDSVNAGKVNQPAWVYFMAFLLITGFIAVFFLTRKRSKSSSDSNRREE